MMSISYLSIKKQAISAIGKQPALCSAPGAVRGEEFLMPSCDLFLYIQHIHLKNMVNQPGRQKSQKFL